MSETIEPKIGDMRVRLLPKCGQRHKETFMACIDCGKGRWQGKNDAETKLRCNSCATKNGWMNPVIRENRTLGLIQSWEGDDARRELFRTKYSGVNSKIYGRKHTKESIEKMAVPAFKVDILPTKEWGYFIGVTLGDGCVTKGSHGNYKIIVSSSRPEIVDKFYECANKLGLHCGYEIQNRHPAGFIKIPFIRYAAVVLSMDLYQQLRPCKQDDFNFFVPKVIYSNNEMISGFLQGFFDAEGGAYKNNKNVSGYNIKCWSKHIENLIQIKNLLKMLGIESYLHNENREKRKVICAAITISDYKNRMLFKDLVGFRIKRKQDKLNSMQNPTGAMYHYTDEQYNRVLELRLKGLKYTEIEKETGVKYTTLSRWCECKRMNGFKDRHAKNDRELLAYT